MAEDTEQPKGRVLKVLYFDEDMQPLGESPSTQLPDDPFEGQMERGQLQAPPVSLEQLVYLAETHPVHGSALEQKALDIIGQGWTWVATTDNPDEAKRDEADKWLRNLVTGELCIDDMLNIYVEDYCKTAQGYLELARDDTGELKKIYHVPSHTCRFHRDGIRIAQIRGEKMVWFKRWGAPTDKHVNRVTGALSDKVPPDKIANELFVLQKPSSRSTWYGMPRYTTAIGWIALALAIRDDNLLFFQNRREPRWAIILSNLEDNDDLEGDLEQAFKIDLKQPHRNIVIPITGQGKVDFQQLSNDRMDGSFEKLGARADAHILASHRMPPDRLGLIRVGVLGGNVAVDSSKVYKDAVIAPEQRLLAARVNRLIEVEFLGKKSEEDAAESFGWKWVPTELNIDTETEDAKNAALLWTAGLLQLNEGRRRIGEDPLEEPEKKEAVDPVPCGDPECIGPECENCIPGSAEEEEEYFGDKFYWQVAKGGGAPPLTPTPEGNDRDRADDALAVDRPSDMGPDTDEEDLLGKGLWGEE